MGFLVKRFEEFSTRELYDLLQVRVSVFVVEQRCPYQELDGKDLVSYHVLYREHDRIQAYLRVVDPTPGHDGVSIGRVLTCTRGNGSGRAIMEKGIQVAREKLNADTVHIEAQVYARGFYERFGFQQTSDAFLEDGIPHIHMLLRL